MEPNYYPNSNDILSCGILRILYMWFDYPIYIMLRLAKFERILFYFGVMREIEKPRGWNVLGFSCTLFSS